MPQPVNERTPYTPGMREVIKLSRTAAWRLGSAQIAPEHYLLGILDKGEGLAIQMLIQMDVDTLQLRQRLEQKASVEKQHHGIPMLEPNDEARLVLERGKEAARQLRHNWVGTEHMLLGILKCANTLPARVLAEFGVDYERAVPVALDVIHGTNTCAKPLKPPSPEDGSIDPVHPS